MAKRTRLAEVLLVEDDPDDIEFAQRAFHRSQLLNALHVVRDGVEAMEFLHRRPPYEGMSVPDLVLLDLGLPRKDGKEVLAEMKADPTLRRVPVVVLTSSMDQEDLLRSYDLGVNSFIRKPVELDGLIDVVKGIEKYWLGLVVLPTDEDALPSGQ